MTRSADGRPPLVRCAPGGSPRIGRSAEEVALVAVHAFDCHGAHAAGLTTGWAGRLEKHYAEIFTRADVIGDDLVDVSRALVALPDR